VSLIRRLIADCPNVVAIKAEGGFPGIMGVVECHRHFGKEVVISCPIEADFIPLAQLMPIQVSATSDHEYFGPMMPRIYRLLQTGEYDQATQLYWQLQPARRAKSGVQQILGDGFFINRMQWKFEAWLQGYNGGPLRQPTMRIHDAQMNALRAGLAASKILPATEPNRCHRLFRLRLRHGRGRAGAASLHRLGQDRRAGRRRAPCQQGVVAPLTIAADYRCRQYLQSEDTIFRALAVRVSWRGREKPGREKWRGNGRANRRASWLPA
jgi:hypothetical protein